jgi:hypothetical protein
MFIEVGGSGAAPPDRPLSGRVVADSRTGQAFTVTVGKSGHFRMLLPLGTYRFNGYTPSVLGGVGCTTAKPFINVWTTTQAIRIQVVCAVG